MISSKELVSLGMPDDSRLMSMALKILNTALHQGADGEILRQELQEMTRHPEQSLNHPLLGTLAQEFKTLHPEGIAYVARNSPAPWRVWGEADIDDAAIEQMDNACSLPIAVCGALMPDAHVGYGLPIGGVLAVRDAVIPYAVGVDIACRMRLSVLDLPVSTLTNKREGLIRAMENETRFGVGASFARSGRRQHPVMDEDWGVSPVTKAFREKAWTQLGTSGSGNHFVEFGELRLETPALGLEKGTYLALLSHSGSRGTGEAVAMHYSQRAMELCPGMPHHLRHLSWLEISGADGQEYWNAMELMGRYAAANHELIHTHVLRAVGSQALAHVENHHNFTWQETHNGQAVIVHRKGATPAGRGVLGIVPGSMGTPGFVVRGKGNPDSLCSCSHGAGRIMSRAAAIKGINPGEASAYLKQQGVELLSGGLDEAPMAYKDIHAVMQAQSDLIDVVARFDPRLVKMAPGKSRKGKK